MATINNKKLNAVAAILTTFILIIFVCCKPHKPASECKSVTFLFNLKIPLRNGELHTMKSSTNIFYYGRYKIYEMPYVYITNKIHLDKFGDELNNNIDSGTRYRYVISNNGEKYGVRFDSINDAMPKRIPIDSFVNATIYPQVPYYPESNNVLLNIFRKKGSSIFIENHAYRIRKDSSYCDTIRYTFDSRLKDREFSFAPKLDSTRRSKVVKVEFITNPTMMYGFKFPKRVSYFEIKNNNVDPVKIQALINNYQKTTGKRIDL